MNKHTPAPVYIVDNYAYVNSLYNLPRPCYMDRLKGVTNEEGKSNMSTVTNRNRFTPDQRKAILASAADKSISQVCKDNSISATTFYKWKDKYSASGSPKVKRNKMLPPNGLNRLEAENSRLKAILFDAVLAGKIDASSFRH